jgi:hypothetical protein
MGLEGIKDVDVDILAIHRTTCKCRYQNLKKWRQNPGTCVLHPHPDAILAHSVHCSLTKDTRHVREGVVRLQCIECSSLA